MVSQVVFNLEVDDAVREFHQDFIIVKYL
jgi:hypothetical protein